MTCGDASTSYGLETQGTWGDSGGIQIATLQLWGQSGGSDGARLDEDAASTLVLILVSIARENGYGLPGGFYSVAFTTAVSNNQVLLHRISHI